MKNTFFTIALYITVTFLPNSGIQATEHEPFLILSGRVTDKITGEPLPGASIYITDDKTGAFANDKGYYSFNNVPAGHHVVEISFTGYSTLVQHIELGSNSTIDFALQPVVTENQGVIITGVSGATSMRKSPVPVTIVRKAALLQSVSSNIIDGLSRVPGVSQVSTGPAISKPVIRGLGFNRVVTINDGVRQEGQQWGDEHGIEIDEMSVGRAEILKGPASLAYGSDAIAGVINIISHIPAAEGTLKGNILSQYQSNGNGYALHGNLAGNRKGFNWNAYGTLKSNGDYKKKYDGKVLNSRFSEKNTGGYIGINKGWGYSHLILSRFTQVTGLVEGDRSLNGEFLVFAGTPLERTASRNDLHSRSKLVPYQRIIHNRVISDNNFVLNKSRLKLNLAYQQNIRQEHGNPEDPAEKELFFDLRTFSYAVQLQLPEKNEWHTSAGIGGMQQSNNNRGEEVLIPGYSLFDLGAFLYVQRFFSRATFSGGLRIDTRSLQADPLDEGGIWRFPPIKRRFTNFSGSAGISYEASDKITLKFNIARGFRAPSIPELASNGTHEGTNRYEYGNETLHPETSLQFDAGVQLNFDHFNISVSPFLNHMNDFIFYRKLQSVSGGDSLVNVDGEDINAFRYDQHDARLMGFEFTWDIHPHPLDWLHIGNSFAFVVGKFNEQREHGVAGSDNLPLIPAPKWDSELRADIKKIGRHVQHAYFKFEVSTSFAQNRPFTGYDTETRTPGYSLLNAGLGFDIRGRKATGCSVHIGVLNILDAAYQNHLSRLKYADVNTVSGRRGVFNPGRNFSVKLNVPLQLGADAR